MNDLKTSFEDVADWCEKHLEGEWGREIGMTFGAMLRAYGRLAALSSRLQGEQRTAKEQQLKADAERLLGELSSRFNVAYEIEAKGVMFVEPSSVRANMMYDTGFRSQE